MELPGIARRSGSSLSNSILVTFLATLGTLLTASMAAYAFARIPFYGRNLWFALTLSTMMLPWAATLIPRFLLFKFMGLFDSLWPLFLPFWFGGGGFYIFLIRQFIMTLPVEMEEAAVVDGASRLRVYLMITMPADQACDRRRWAFCPLSTTGTTLYRR